MNSLATDVRTPATLWEVEWRVVEIACEQLGLDRARVSPQSRLLEDLHVDSLHLVEFVMEIEEAFAVTIPDESCADC